MHLMTNISITMSLLICQINEYYLEGGNKRNLLGKIQFDKLLVGDEYEYDILLEVLKYFLFDI